MNLLGSINEISGDLASLRYCTEKTGAGRMMFPAELVKRGISWNLYFSSNRQQASVVGAFRVEFFKYILDEIF